MSRTSDMPVQTSPRPTSRRRAAVLSTIVPMPSFFHLSHASPEAEVEIGKWLKLVESHLRRAPRRKKA